MKNTFIALASAAAVGLFSISTVQADDLDLEIDQALSELENSDEVANMIDLLQFEQALAIGMQGLLATNVSVDELREHAKAAAEGDMKYDLDNDGKVTDREIYKFATGLDLPF